MERKRKKPKYAERNRKNKFFTAVHYGEGVRTYCGTRTFSPLVTLDRSAVTCKTCSRGVNG